MKKFFAVAATALFIMTSCSGDDAAPVTNSPGENSTNLVLLKKIIETGPDGVDTQIFTYNGNKLTGISHTTGENEIITYEGNLIKSWKIYGSDDELLEEHTYFYENNWLKKSIRTYYDMDGSTDTSVYTLNPDGTVSCMIDSSGTEEFESLVYYPTKYSRHISAFGDDNLMWYNHDFDNKKTPYLNISGYDKIVYDIDFSPLQFGNNITSEYTTQANGAFNQQIRTSTYTYNNNDYPVTEHRIDFETDVTDYQYFYE